MNIQVTCSGCGSTFEKPQSEVRKHQKRGFNNHYCSRPCLDASKRLTVSCLYCFKQFVRVKSEAQGKNFCSRTCAATYNNKLVIKKKKKPGSPCTNCGSPCASKRKYCKDCIAQGEHLTGDPVNGDRTIASMLRREGKDANRYNFIRQHARKVTSTREQKCQICGYSLHVETCHIRDIADFDLEAKLSEVNAPDNLALLCRNHHWELDHGHLTIRPEGIEPPCRGKPEEDYESSAPAIVR